MVTDYPLVDIDTRIAEVDNIKYPMAGMTNEQVKLGVFNVNSKETGSDSDKSPPIAFTHRVYLSLAHPIVSIFQMTTFNWGDPEPFSQLHGPVGAEPIHQANCSTVALGTCDDDMVALKPR